MITEEFLWEKINKLLHYWEEAGERSNIGRVFHANQICETPKGNYSFVIYNLCGFLNGHFLFTVNLETFEYAIQMHSYYGSFTWTSPPTEDNIYTKNCIPEIERLKIEAYIAYTLYLCLYHSDSVIDLNTQILVSGAHWYTDLLTKLT